MKRDIEIAQETTLWPIAQVASGLGWTADDLELYGRYKAKITYAAMARAATGPQGKLILVTAISPTPAGEGKSTTTVGLGQALAQLGERVMIALREPSLGPCMGIKGGAAGGGYSQVVPMEDINLHFTGDLHAITAAHNLLAAMLDNHLQQGNELDIDPRRIVWKRVVDLNDRALRQIVIGLGGKVNGVPREDGFDITVASEIMAILCLAHDLDDLKARIARIVVAYRRDGHPVTAGELHAQGALTALLKDALKPNLVQTLEHVPAFVHGGPFANIAHGCNSLAATKTALHMADYVVTEAGFGADLGAEKFFDIKCRYGNLTPRAAVVVATVRALKMHGGVAKADLDTPNPEAVRLGCVNLEKHLENVAAFGVPVVVALNEFATDTQEEREQVMACCARHGVPAVLSAVFADGGAGGIELAKTVRTLAEVESSFAPLYPLEMSAAEKIRTIATRIYGAADVVFAPKAEKTLAELDAYGYGNLPVCIAKTPYSFSDDPTLIGRPEGFTLHVRELRVAAGAGFIVALTGDVMTMPGLPKRPAAEQIDVDAQGRISGLF